MSFMHAVQMISLLNVCILIIEFSFYSLTIVVTVNLKADLTADLNIIVVHVFDEIADEVSDEVNFNENVCEANAI